MLSSRPGMSVVSPLFEHCFKVSLRSAVFSDKGPSVHVGDSPLNYVFSSMHNPLVAGRGTSDLLVR